MLKRADEEILFELRRKIEHCPLCSGTNLDCNCYKAFHFALAQIQANIPEKYRPFESSDISDPSSQKVVKRIQVYIKNLKDYRRKGTGLYLFGNPGTAKTVLGSIVLSSALRRRYTAYFTNVDSYLDIISERNSEESQTLAKHIARVDFLLIDDVGREYRDAKGYIESHLDELIRFRTDNLLPIIITTNKTQADLSANNFRLESILKEHFISIPFTSKDYRKKIGADLHEAESQG